MERYGQASYSDREDFRSGDADVRPEGERQHPRYGGRVVGIRSAEEGGIVRRCTGADVANRIEIRPADGEAGATAAPTTKPDPMPRPAAAKDGNVARQVFHEAHVAVDTSIGIDRRWIRLEDSISVLIAVAQC